MRARHICVYLTIVLALSRCDELTSPDQNWLSKRVVYSGTLTGYPVATRDAIRTDNEWEAAWNAIHSNTETMPPRPMINFREEMLILTARGPFPTGCFSTSVKAVLATSSRTVAYIEDVDRVACGCPLVVTSPVEVVAVKNREGAVDVSVNRVIRRCS